MTLPPIKPELIFAGNAFLILGGASLMLIGYFYGEQFQTLIIIFAIFLILLGLGFSLFYYLRYGSPFTDRVIENVEFGISHYRYDEGFPDETFERYFNQLKDLGRYLEAELLRRIRRRGVKSPHGDPSDYILYLTPDETLVLERLRSQLRSYYNSGRISDNERDYAYPERDRIRDSDSDYVPPEILTFEQLRSRFSSDAERLFHLTSLRKQSQNTIVRISTELDALARRANVNLVVGSVTTVLGLFVLGFMVFSGVLTVEISSGEDISRIAWTSVVAFLPRLSLVIFIQIFAFFFLRMYRVSLQEIKYFQNELTNVECRITALESAIMSGDQESFRGVIKVLAQTERNFILSKGQSTVELEKARIENDTVRYLFGTLTSNPLGRRISRNQRHGSLK